MTCPAVINYISPFLILALTIFGYYAFVIQFCIFRLTNYAKQCAYIFAYNLFFWMFVWSLAQTVLEPHPPIPAEYRLADDEHKRLQGFSQEQVDNILNRLVALRQLELHTRTQSGKVRYCNKCHQIKPDRTHHCSACERCILKMDHHCPWVGNCIGFGNYKAFILMLFYACLMLVCYVGPVSEYIVEYWRGLETNFGNLYVVIGYIQGVLGLVLVGALLIYHLNLVTQNETTLESVQDTFFLNPNGTFDTGCWNNWVEVFGSNVCAWFFPFNCCPTGNGYEFQAERSRVFES